jgi:hypothetical protein
VLCYGWPPDDESVAKGSHSAAYVFGQFVSVAGTRFRRRNGSWNVHGGVEYQALGETTEFFNGGDSSRTIGSIGFGFTY